VSMETLMENAGTACAQFILEKTDVENKTVVILCGKGNNGGDGFVIARVLAKAGARVTVVLMQGAPAAELARKAYDKMHKGIEIILPKNAGDVIDCADVIVDAIFGFGFCGSLPHFMEKTVERANAANALRVSVDIPSGAECDTGAVEGVCFRAHWTVTFTAMKPAGVVYPAAGFCGKTVVRQVGIKKEFLDMLPCDMKTVRLKHLAPLFPKRDPEGHKGTYGRLLMICGSIGMAGACIMAARAALRSGVGLLNIAIPHALYPIMAQAVPEAVFTLYDTDETMEDRITDVLLRADACLIGCGLSTAPYAERLVHTVLERAKCPLVLDADALNILAKTPETLLTAMKPVIITPHPGEMSRLCGDSMEQIRENRIGTARAFAAKYHVHTVLKGAGTVIAAPDGEVRVNTTGNSGMAKGGSGDVLAGIAGSLLAQKLPAFEAAYAAVCLHGAAGDRCAERLSQHAMLPTDLIEALPAIFREVEGK
ncbi:MAG: NAD(P)H-hydrate dehydratase, partial [Clostridia bacterium]|nr:NAD(P)H-hydrate dehydratase [Clostridia bacterium]